jgi:hypothetical protein
MVLACQSSLQSVALTAALQFVPSPNTLGTAGWTDLRVAVSQVVYGMGWGGGFLAYPGPIRCVLVLAGMATLLAWRNKSSADWRCCAQVLIAATAAVVMVHLTNSGRVPHLLLRVSGELSMRMWTVLGWPARLAMTAACFHSVRHMVARVAATALKCCTILVAGCAGLLSAVVVFATGPLVITALLALRACTVWRARPKSGNLASTQDPADREEPEPCSPVRDEAGIAGQPSPPPAPPQPNGCYGDSESGCGTVGGPPFHCWLDQPGTPRRNGGVPPEPDGAPHRAGTHGRSPDKSEGQATSPEMGDRRGPGNNQEEVCGQSLPQDSSRWHEVLQHDCYDHGHAGS